MQEEMAHEAIYDDWRLVNQLQYLHGVRLSLRAYHKPAGRWDVDVCEFCAKKFAEVAVDGMVQQGYAVAGTDQWVCEKCYADFKGLFEWGG